MSVRQQILIAGYMGLIGAILVGLGEFLLHFDIQGRFMGGFDFMQGISANRSTWGHFIGVLSAPLYIVGYWHLMKMLEPAGKTASKVAFTVMSYGIFMGAIWIGSRSSISAIINDATITNATNLIALYELRYENLLTVTRVAALVFSGLFIWLILTGKTHYPKWMALFNPIVLILASFAVWIAIPAIGVYLMPIALNIAFAILFGVSLYFAHKLQDKKD